MVVCLTVAVNGIGMTPSQVGKLFKAFRQGGDGGPRDISFRRQFGGSGLGLSILSSWLWT